MSVRVRFRAYQLGVWLMPNEGIPITAAIITWARTRSGLTIEEATEKFARIAAGETQRSVARSYNVSQSTISRL